MEDVLQRIEQKIDAMGGRLEVVEGDLSSVKVTLGEVKTALSGLTGTVHKQGALQEEMRDDIKQTLEGVVFLRESTGRRFDEVISKIDERVQPIELATRYLATRKSPE